MQGKWLKCIETMSQLCNGFAGMINVIFVFLFEDIGTFIYVLHVTNLNILLL